MQKPAVMLVVSAVLIAAGLVLLLVGNQVILEGVSQGSGSVGTGQDLVIESEFAAESQGVFAIQVIDRQDGMSARVLGPAEHEILSLDIDSDSIERRFDAGSGVFKLIVQGSSSKESQVFGAIGPVPDAAKKSLGFLSSYVLIVGMAGLAASVIYGIIKKRSV